MIKIFKRNFLIQINPKNKYKLIYLVYFLFYLNKNWNIRRIEIYKKH